MILFAANDSWWGQLTLGKLAEAALVLAVTLIVARVAQGSLERLGEIAPRSRFFFKMLVPIANFTLWLLALALIASIFAPSPEALLALTASLGIAIGLGAQDLVKNLIGGVVIMTDRPYQLGDRVQIGDATGEIDHIGLRSTKMTNFDDTRITIPNSEILTGRVWNSNSGVPDEQVMLEIYLKHTADPHQAIQVGHEAAVCSPYIYMAKPVVCLVQDYLNERPYLILRIKAYVFDHRAEKRFQSDVTARAKTAIRELGMLPD